jgi:EmrB/QacA subfamily drug resistance transporter
MTDEAPPVQRGPGVRTAPALGTVLAVLFLTFLDTTIVTVALGDIQQHFGAGVISLQWVVNAYALVFAGLMLMAGSLGDRFGRRTVMAVGIGVFCAGSVLSALAPNVGTLIAGRAVMGVGAAASEPGTLSVLRQLYPARAARAKALGAWAAVSGLALATGPVIGGLLVAAGGWSWVFWFNLIAGVVLFGATLRYVPNSSDPQPGRLDVGGFVLGTAGLCALIFAVLSGEQHGFTAAWVLALFAGGGACLIAFVVVELRERSPMLDLRYLRRPLIGSALFMAFAVYFGVFSIFFFTALYLDLAIGYSALKLALMFTPMAVAIVVAAVVAGRWVGRAGSRIPMIAGSTLGAVGIVATRFALTRHPQFGSLTLTLTIAGLGFGVAVVPVTSAVLTSIPARHSGMAASATNTARQLGAVVGVAALGAVVNSHLTSDLSDRLAKLGVGKALRDPIIHAVETGGSDAAGFDIAHPPALFAPIVNQATAAFRTGVHESLYASAALMLLAAVLTLLVPRRHDTETATTAD